MVAPLWPGFSLGTHCELTEELDGVSDCQVMATAHCPSADEETFGEDVAVNSCIYDTKAERQL